MTRSTPPTLTAALHRAAATATPLAFLDRRERRVEITWAEVRARGLSVAAGLATLGVEPGDRVGLVYPTGREFFDAFFGVLLAGGVPVPLYPPVRLGRVDEYRRRTASLLRRAGARALLAGGRTARILAAAGDSFADLGTHDVDELARAGDGFVAHDPDPDELALIQFSSGTTAEPKPAALCHRALVAQVTALNRFWPATDGVDHGGMSWLPLYHDMGLVGCVLVAVTRPGPLTLMPPELFIARPAAWLRALSDTRATVSPAPTFAFAHCVDRIRDEEIDGVDLSAWRFALCGAETVVPEVLERFADRFSRWGFRRQALMPGYGLAEAALAVTFTRPGRGLVSRRFSRRALSDDGRAEEDPNGVAIASLGEPLPGFAVEIRRQRDNPLAPGRARRDAPPKERSIPLAPGRAPGRIGRDASPEARSIPLAPGRIGRVWARGPSLMDGYLGDPRATASTLVEGWLDTGDLGFLLDGELFLTGRARDVLILRGRNHAPEEVERAVERVPGVAAGGAAAVSHLGPGQESERLFVFVESRSGPEIEEACRRELLAVTGLAADEVVVLPPGALPRTSSGKLRRQAALARHLTGQTGS